MFQITAVGTTIIINGTLDTLSSGCFSLITVLFHILKNELMNLKEVGSENKMRSKIKQYISFHNDIFKFAALVEDTFSFGIFVQILSSIVVICMSAFRLLLVRWKTLFSNSIYLEVLRFRHEALYLCQHLPICLL